MLHYCGRDVEALNHNRLALHRSPFSPTYFKLILVKTLIANENFDEAIVMLKVLSHSENQDVQVHMLSCLLAVHQGAGELAGECTQEILRYEPDFTVKEYLAFEPYRIDDFKRRLAADLIECGLPA